MSLQHLESLLFQCSGLHPPDHDSNALKRKSHVSPLSPTTFRQASSLAMKLKLAREKRAKDLVAAEEASAAQKLQEQQCSTSVTAGHGSFQQQADICKLSLPVIYKRKELPRPIPVKREVVSESKSEMTAAATASPCSPLLQATPKAHAKTQESATKAHTKRIKRELACEQLKADFKRKYPIVNWPWAQPGQPQQPRVRRRRTRLFDFSNCALCEAEQTEGQCLCGPQGPSFLA